MDMIEALAYVIGFFLIWMSTMGMVWVLDNWVVRPIFGRTIIKPEFWQ